jgi:hypothetical protein
MQAAGGRPLQGTTLSFAAAREREREKRTQSARSQDARFLRLFTSDFLEF